MNGECLTRPLAATKQEIRNPNIEILNKFDIQNSRAETSAAGKTTVMGHKQILITGHATGCSGLRAFLILSLVFLSFGFVWDFVLRASSFGFVSNMRSPCAHAAAQYA